jgi:hypothetical protein
VIPVPVTYVARLWLPDIPGTLGLVAAAIGRASGDVTGIEILERGAGMAIDELLIGLPDSSHLETLISELSGVPGVSIEDVHRVDPERQDQSVLALDVAARIVESPVHERLATACVLLQSMLEADWCAVMGRDAPDVTEGTIPEPGWLRAFLEGIRHLDVDTSLEHTPGDVAWAPLSRFGGFVVCGRASRSFRSRERQHLALVVRIVDSVLADGPLSRAIDGS